MSLHFSIEIGLTPTRLIFPNYIERYHFPNHHMMTASNGNIFRVTGHLCGEFTGPDEFPSQRPVTRSFDVGKTIMRLVIWDAVVPIMTSQ